MPDVDEAAVDQPSDGAATESYPDDSLPADDAAAEKPETQTADQSAATESEGESAETETTESEGETETQSSQDEFLQSLTPEELAYYAKRYPTLYKAYGDPNQPADLRQAFVDRVNQDHAYAELRDGQGAEEGEPTAEASTQPANAEEATKQYYAQIDDIVSKQIDQTKVNELGSNLLEAMGVDIKSKDPEIQAIVKNAPKVGQVLARGAIDLMATVLPQLLPSRLEAAMPDIGAMYYENLTARTWDEVRQMKVKGSDGKETQPYSKLPAIGSPEWNSQIDKVLTEMPELRDLYPNLPPKQRFTAQYKIAARLMTGQQVSPAVVAKAVETGKDLARKAAVQRSAGKALGGGRSTQQLGAKTGEEDDPIMADLDRAISAANQALSPLSPQKS